MLRRETRGQRRGARRRRGARLQLSTRGDDARLTTGEAAVLPYARERVAAEVGRGTAAALGVLAAFQEAGCSVPAHVSVVGYDDSPLARLATVGLTSVSQATRPMAVAAVRAATQRLDEGRSEVVEVVLEPHLEVRRTTGPVGERR